MTHHKSFALIPLILSVLLISGWWFSWRPQNIRKQCYAEKQSAMAQRRKDNLGYYFVSMTPENFENELEAGRNRPMYVKDLNARLDEYWGDVAYKDCLNKNGLE
jgi:hypothetical protein